METDTGVRRNRRLDVALVLIFLAVVAPFVPGLHAQEASRYAFTAAMAEQGRFEVDDYEELLSADRIDHGGHVYSDKAPGQPILGVPVLKVAEWMGADPGTETRHYGNLGAWSLSLVFCVVPGAALLVLMRRNAARTEPAIWAVTAAMALSFGTLLLPMSSALYAHVFVAFLTFLAWHILSGTDVTPPRVLAAGALTAVAVACEYPMIAVAAVLCGYVVVTKGPRMGALFAFPQLLAVGFAIWMNDVIFGFVGTSYDTKGDDGLTVPPVIPDLGHLARIFFGEKGYLWTPVVILGTVGLVQLLLRRRWDLVVPALVFGGFVWLQSSWSNPWGGEPPGSRYILPALPFLVVPVAYVLPKLRGAVRNSLIGIGVVTMTLPLLTMPLVRDDETLLFGHLNNIDRFGLTHTVFEMALGPIGWLLHLGLVAAALAHLRRVWPASDVQREPTGHDAAVS